MWSCTAVCIRKVVLFWVVYNKLSCLCFVGTNRPPAEVKTQQMLKVGNVVMSNFNFIIFSHTFKIIECGLLSEKNSLTHASNGWLKERMLSVQTEADIHNICLFHNHNFSKKNSFSWNAFKINSNNTEADRSKNW